MATLSPQELVAQIERLSVQEGYAFLERLGNISAGIAPLLLWGGLPPSEKISFSMMFGAQSLNCWLPILVPIAMRVEREMSNADDATKAAEITRRFKEELDNSNAVMQEKANADAKEKQGKGAKVKKNTTRQRNVEIDKLIDAGINKPTKIRDVLLETCRGLMNGQKGMPITLAAMKKAYYRERGRHFYADKPG